MTHAHAEAARNIKSAAEQANNQDRIRICRENEDRLHETACLFVYVTISDIQ